MKEILLFADVGLSEAGLTALIGIAVILAVLAVLMLFVKLMSSITDRMLGGDSKETKAVPHRNEYNQGSSVIAKAQYTQPQDELTLINVSESDAAIIMAIVAQQSNLPLEKLRFESIKLVGEQK